VSLDLGAHVFMHSGLSLNPGVTMELVEERIRLPATCVGSRFLRAVAVWWMEVVWREKKDSHV
jgi:hypothetical protein